MSDKSVKLLSSTGIADQIDFAMGVSVDDITTSETILVTILVDDSVSMRSNEQTVRDGMEVVRQSLADTKQADGIFMMARTFSGEVLFPYMNVQSVPKIDNYRASLSHTPLYDQTLTTAAAVTTKTAIIENDGISVRTITLIITDGMDNSSSHDTDAVKMVITDMLNAEKHIVAGMGIGNNFRDVFLNMGIADTWILTPGNTQSDIRNAFNMFSQSAVRVSQTSNIQAAGGFV